MPNYCSCRIIITGGSLPVFKKTLNTDNSSGEKVLFSFHQTVPIPDKYNGSYSDIWGTKSEGDTWMEKYIITDDEVDIFTETAWSVPGQWAESCMKKFDDLHIKIAWSEAMSQHYGIWEDGNDSCIKFNDDDFKYSEEEDDYIIGGDLKKHVEKYEIGLGG